MPGIVPAVVDGLRAGWNPIGHLLKEHPWIETTATTVGIAAGAYGGMHGILGSNGSSPSPWAMGAGAVSVGLTGYKVVRAVNTNVAGVTSLLQTHAGKGLLLSGGAFVAGIGAAVAVRYLTPAPAPGSCSKSGFFF